MAAIEDESRRFNAVVAAAEKLGLPVGAEELSIAASMNAAGKLEVRPPLHAKHKRLLAAAVDGVAVIA